MRGLDGKNALVTGGGAGIGRAICRRLGEEGVTVGVLDRDGPAARETADLIAGSGGRATAFEADITDYDAVADAVSAFEAAAGPLDILVNNAGIDVAMPFLDTDAGLWRRIVEINLFGPLNLHHIAVRSMAGRRSGKVINISSDAARVGSSGESVYAACKGGIISFSKTLARELARRNVQVNCICPGPTDTNLFRTFAGDGEAGQKLVAALERGIPMRRLGQPDDYPGLVAFLASSDADFITGQTISVSGGLTMAG